MVNTYQARAIGEYRLYLQQCNHIGHALHNVASAQHGCRLRHNLLDGLTLTRTLKRGRCDVGNSLGVVELQALLESPLGNQAEGKQCQLINFSWC